MNKKFFLSGFVTGIVAFFLGWVIWGIILMDFSTANTTEYPGLVKENMSFPAILLNNLLWGFTITWIYGSFRGVKTVKGGALTGMILGLLVSAGLNLSYFAFWNIYTPLFQIVDVVANGIFSGVLGGVAGYFLRTKS